jgi:hypothetical protein
MTLRTVPFVAAAGAASLLMAGCAGASTDVGSDVDAKIDGRPTAEAATDDDCSAEGLSDGDAEFVFTSAFRVVGGVLAERCFGVDDRMIRSAWESLAAIAPADQLGDVALFAGFEPDGDNAAETLAFVNALDADGSSFQMSVNVVEAAVDADELLLTLAHEFTHVFTATGTELDRTDEGIEACATYLTDEGCYLDDSLMLAWVDEFWAGVSWAGDVLEGVGPVEDTADAADDRCAADDGFFGPYAATDPEEDFAEAFSAFVFRLEPATDGQAERLDWIGRQPGLAEFRDRADAAGLTPLANTFEVCGR